MNICFSWRILFLTQAGILLLLGSLPARAATWIGDQNSWFTRENPEQILMSGPNAWADIDTGGLGSTDASAWGTVSLKKGKRVVITVQSEDPNYHPGVSVWYRPQGAGLVTVDYAWSHYYRQTENIVANGVQLEVTREPLGDLRMWFVRNGWDKDGAPAIPPEDRDPSLRAVKDGVPGRVKLVFTPKNTGIHQFVVGGYHPGPGPVNPTLRYPLTVSIKGIPKSP